MKTIPLTRGRVALVDDGDYADLSQFKWCAAKRKNTFYAVHAIVSNGKRIFELMHRRILGAMAGEKVDHENHNGLDCQRHNIRKCTQMQNLGNMRKHSDHSSRFKGVSWHKRDKKWYAYICPKGKHIHLGLFTDDVLAALTYDDAARKHFREFAYTNFPQPTK